MVETAVYMRGNNEMKEPEGMLLEVRDLHAYYGLSHVLQGISLAVGRGEIVCLLGRNGMGKSTTLKSIMGLVKPRSGSITFMENEIARRPAHKIAQAGVGYVPEERRIFPNLSVLDNLNLGVRESSARTAKDGTAWTLDRVFHYFPTLKERIHSRGAHLSGGEQQMLAIGRALMCNPSLLLVDEPTEGLAPLMVRTVRDVIESVNQSQVSILMVEHSIEIALSLAHRVYVMGKGKIAFSGTVSEFHQNPEIRQTHLEV